MQCPHCSCEDSRVTDSRAIDDGIRRRRECLRCGGRFTTYERVQASGMLVVKKDGRREPFSREKILHGLQKACEKRPLEAAAVVALADEIEARVHQEGLVEVPSTLIGEWAMQALREIDQIAYVRFASVYRSFADVGELREILDEFEGGRGPRPPREQLPLLNEATLDLLRRPHAQEGSRLIPFRESQRPKARTTKAASD
jgi:transcriptional repressor NrdR